MKGSITIICAIFAFNARVDSTTPVADPTTPAAEPTTPAAEPTTPGADPSTTGPDPTTPIPVVIDDFICIRDGIFPDMDCSKYHVCQNKTATKMSCQPGEYFDGNSQDCSPTAPCGTFDCRQELENKVPHSEYPRYFTICPRAEEPLVVAACPQGYQLDPVSQDCQAKCIQEEVIADNTDCHFYIKCVYKDSQLVMSKYKCPEGQAYNPDSLLCTDEKLVQNCNK